MVPTRVGLDTSKMKISVAPAEEGRQGEVRFLGDIDNTPDTKDGPTKAGITSNWKDDLGSWLEPFLDHWPQGRGGECVRFTWQG